MRALYSLLWLLATPLVVAYLLARSLRQPDYRRHWGERFGRHPRRDGPGPLIWIHAVSVGETRAAQPLVAALERAFPEASLLMTHMTPTGRETARELFGDRVRSAYLPYDHPWAQRRFLQAWRPAVGILIETELWPNLMAAAAAAGVPVALVNARLSERSLRRGLRWHALVGPAARRLALVAAQTDADAVRLARVGRAADSVTGNLKFDNQPAVERVELGRAWRRRLAPRPVLLAASTREGEESLLLAAWRGLRERGAAGDTLLAIVPRHPQRFDEVAQAITAAGFTTARRAALDDPTVDFGRVDVLLGDSMGEMAAWYTLADCAVIGGSLLPYGSQNLIEACAVGCPVVLGPHTFNFAEAAARAIEAGAALTVAGADEALAAGLAVLADPARRAAMSEAGSSFAQRHRGATARTLRVLGPVLERALRRGG